MPSKNGWFSTASALELITNKINHTPCLNGWIWKLNTYPKVKNFLWKIEKDGLLTKERLNRQAIATTPGCMFCDCQDENFEHLFIKCPYTSGLIGAINNNVGQILRNLDTSNKRDRTILKELEQRLSKQEILDLVVSWWCIWHQRNKLVFQQSLDDKIDNMEGYIKLQLASWNKVKIWNDEEEERPKGTSNKPIKKQRNIVWKKPDQGFQKSTLMDLKGIMTQQQQDTLFETT